MGNYLDKLQCYKRREKRTLPESLKPGKMPSLSFVSGALLPKVSSSQKQNTTAKAPSSCPPCALQKEPPDKPKLPPGLMQLISSGLFSDRDRVLLIIRKQREIMLGVESQRLFEEEVDPTKPDVLIKLKQSYVAIDRRVLTELGLENRVTDWNHFPGLFPPIFALYMNDSEIMKEIQHLTSMPRPDTLQPGSPSPDVSLVSMAVIMGGTLSRLYHDYHDQANFLCIYLAEAHPTDRWSLGATFSSLTQHVTLEQRMDAARELLDKDDKQHHILSKNPFDRNRVPLVVDTMDNSFANIYNALPDRVFIIEGGVLVYIGDDIMKQMSRPNRLMTHEIREWLEKRHSDGQKSPLSTN